MFLPVKRADCTDVLNRLMYAIQRILEYSVQSLFQPLDFQVLSDLVGPEFAPLLSYSKIRSAIEGIFQLSYLEKLEICNAFVNDAAFDQHINDDAYHLSALSESGAKALKLLCDPLYDIAGRGFPSDSSSPKFSGKLLRQQYATINNLLGRVCPVCVGEILFTKGEGQNDHYFPRSKFPTLTLHPYNLLPTCPSCNGPSFKHEKSPVEETDAGPGELQTVFLPYLRPAKPEVTLGVGENCNIVITPSHGTDKHTIQRIQNMDRLYKLEDRWSGVLSNVCDDIESEWQSICTQYSMTSERLAALRKLLKNNASNTKNRSDFIKGVYCEWLLTKSDSALEKWISSYQQLNIE